MWECLKIIVKFFKSKIMFSRVQIPPAVEIEADEISEVLRRMQRLSKVQIADGDFDTIRRYAAELASVLAGLKLWAVARRMVGAPEVFRWDLLIVGTVQLAESHDFLLEHSPKFDTLEEGLRPILLRLTTCEPPFSIPEVVELFSRYRYQP